MKHLVVTLRTAIRDRVRGRVAQGDVAVKTKQSKQVRHKTESQASVPETLDKAQFESRR